MKINKDKEKQIQKTKPKAVVRRWAGGMAESHPILGYHFKPYSIRKILYPDNPRDYFKEESIRERKWQLTVHKGNFANLILPPENPEVVRIAIEKITTKKPWHIQLQHPPVALKANQGYAVRFRARADKPRRIVLGVFQLHKPWDLVGLSRKVQLT